jgi:hypothetical protein
MPTAAGAMFVQSDPKFSLFRTKQKANMNRSVLLSVDAALLASTLYLLSRKEPVSLLKLIKYLLFLRARATR